MKLKVGDKFSNVTKNRAYMLQPDMIFTVKKIEYKIHNDRNEITNLYYCEDVESSKYGGTYNLYEDELYGIKGPEVKSNKPAWF